MKYVRKAAEAPKAEPMPAPVSAPVPAAVDASEIVAAIKALRDAAARIESPRVEVTVPTPKVSRPSAFTVRITKRDSKGRALEFDVQVKSDQGPEDDLEAGFNEATRQ